MALDYIQIAEAVSREKDIDKTLVLEAMEQAIQMAARKKLANELRLQPYELTVKASIDPVSGDISLKRLVQVVKMVMEPLSVEEARTAQREGRASAASSLRRTNHAAASWPSGGIH